MPFNEQSISVKADRVLVVVRSEDWLDAQAAHAVLASPSALTSHPSHPQSRSLLSKLLALAAFSALLAQPVAVAAVSKPKVAVSCTGTADRRVRTCQIYRSAADRKAGRTPQASSGEVFYGGVWQTIIWTTATPILSKEAYIYYEDATSIRVTSDAELTSWIQCTKVGKRLQSCAEYSTDEEFEQNFPDWDSDVPPSSLPQAKTASPSTVAPPTAALPPTTQAPLCSDAEYKALDDQAREIQRWINALPPTDSYSNDVLTNKNGLADVLRRQKSLSDAMWRCLRKK